MEAAATEKGHNITTMTLQEMDEIWNEIKKQQL
jgi:uncharacterized protein YabN with tetrapyrrole methylase and pyrophosphatase domain